MPNCKHEKPQMEVSIDILAQPWRTMQQCNETTLLVLINSQADDGSIRATIRETWLQSSHDGNVTHAFVVGRLHDRRNAMFQKLSFALMRVRCA